MRIKTLLEFALALYSVLKTSDKNIKNILWYLSLPTKQILYDFL